MKCNLTATQRRWYMAAGGVLVLASALAPGSPWARGLAACLGTLVVLEGVVGF